jgi:hypothetical protein
VDGEELPSVAEGFLAFILNLGLYTLRKPGKYEVNSVSSSPLSGDSERLKVSPANRITANKICSILATRRINVFDHKPF